MVEDASTAHAREMLGSLEECLAEISRKLERVEAEGDRRASMRGASLHRRQRAELRREFYEAHRLIDGSTYQAFAGAQIRTASSTASGWWWSTSSIADSLRHAASAPQLAVSSRRSRS
jgi:hypothetical protein